MYNLRLSHHAAALVLLVSCAWLINGGLAGPITGTKYPFESCVANPFHSRFYATLVKEEWVPRTQTSNVCFMFHLKDAEECTQTNNRCCTNDQFVKFKIFPRKGCKGSVASIRINNGRTISSLYDDRPFMREDNYILKVTKLNFNNRNINGSTICWTLRRPCNTLYKFTNPATRDKGMLEYSLYDKKYLDTASRRKGTMTKPYECCPTGVFIFNETAAAESGYDLSGFEGGVVSRRRK